MQDSRTCRAKKLEVVGNNEECFALLREQAEQTCHSEHAASVQSAGGFVKEKHVFLVYEANRNSKALFLAT
jgi:hypothetical protein